MSQLKGLTGVAIKTASVELPGGDSFVVRGLSLSDIVTIYNQHMGELGIWFEQMLLLDGGDSELKLEPSNIASNLLNTAPTLAAEIVAFGSGECSIETVAIAMQLPISVQIDALQKIGGLTFTESMPPKKVFEVVIQAARTAASQANPQP